MSSAPSADEIARDARWLAQALDPSEGVARLVAMDREAYRAGKLPRRSADAAAVDAQIVAWPQIEAAMDGDLRSDARWIFHIGHVGSTLVSRLLGELRRRAGPARATIAARSGADARPKSASATLPPVPKLMSRTFGAEEIACVKATSFVSEIAR